MKHFISIILFLLAFASLAGAQQTIFDEDETIVYKNALYGGLMFHNNGWGITMNYAQNKTISRARYWELEIVSMKHPKERRRSINDEAGSYIFGKINSLHVIRPMWGQRRVLNEKIRESGVEIGYTYAFGPALGLAKPVYLEISQEANGLTPIAVERYDPDKHPPRFIYGRASWFRGLDKMRLYPGLAAKFSMFAEFATEREKYTEIEVGATLDAFNEKVPIMANDLNKQFFLNFFVAIHFGKKFNQ